jgi:hypothetical protein
VKDSVQGRAAETVDNMVVWISAVVIVSRLCAGRNTAAGDQKFCDFRPTYRLSGNFIAVNYTKFPDAATKSVVVS